MSKTSKAIYTMVAMSLPNLTIAERFIRDNAEKVNPQYQTFVSSMWLLSFGPKAGTLPIARIMKIVDHFMAQYPRGKGTAGNELLREFYAACYAFKVAKSRKRYWQVPGGLASLSSLSETMQTALANFPVDGSPMSAKTIRTNTMMALYDRGMTDGDGETIYLSDRGIEMRKIMIAKQGEQEKVRIETAKTEMAAVGETVKKTLADLKIASRSKRFRETGDAYDTIDINLFTGNASTPIHYAAIQIHGDIIAVFEPLLDQFGITVDG